MKKLQDDLDLRMYDLTEKSKLITQQRLQIDVANSKCEGLLSEKRHSQTLLKEMTEFKELFEEDNTKLRDEYTSLLEKYNAVN